MTADCPARAPLRRHHSRPECFQRDAPRFSFHPNSQPGTGRRRSRGRRGRANFFQARPRKSKEIQGKQIWIFLDFLGFLRPILDFSMGYTESKSKKLDPPKCSDRPSAPFPRDMPQRQGMRYARRSLSRPWRSERRDDGLRPRRALPPDLVGSRLPAPCHFRARNQSFQGFAAPFAGAMRRSCRAVRRAQKPSSRVQRGD